MRLDIRDNELRVCLSRRNLTSLLAKLDGHPPDSACTLTTNDVYVNGEPVYGALLLVTAVSDAEHYADRAAPGEVHCLTEEAMDILFGVSPPTDELPARDGTKTA